MIRLQRDEFQAEPLRVDDREVTLVSRRLTLRIATPWFGFGWTYAHPHQVSGVTIRDHVMVVRIAAIGLFLVGMLIRRMR